LGLYTVYGIVKEHGGEIHVLSEPNSGTTFNLSFPLAVRQDFEEEEMESLKRGNGQKILLVDDEAELFASQEKLLSELGYQVNSVKSGKAAVSKYRTWHPDIVLLDRNMPEMDGITCAQKLIDLDAEAKIVLVSGYEETGPQGINDKTKSIIKGYLTKPIDMALLSSLLDELIRN
jgi:two-component system cell cycle sensor histidine kinase/response regulator CckA